MNNPLISVIIPVYNVENYLEECVNSILNQTYSNLEVILVNDGSPDNSAAICDRYAKNDGRVIVVHKKNGGLSDARNAGLDICKGEFIAFVDSDDVVHRQFIEKLHENIDDVDLVFCEYQAFENGDILDNVQRFEEQLTYTTDEFYNKLVFNYTPKLVIACNKLYRKHIFSDLRYPVGKVHEDEFLIHHIVKQSSKIRYLNQPLYYYRQDSNGITSFFTEKKFKDKLMALSDRIDFFSSINKSLHAKQVYNQMYFLFLNKNILVDGLFFENLNFGRIISDQRFRSWLKFQLIFKLYFEWGYNSVFYPLNESRIKFAQKIR